MVTDLSVKERERLTLATPMVLCAGFTTVGKLDLTFFGGRLGIGNASESMMVTDGTPLLLPVPPALSVTPRRNEPTFPASSPLGVESDNSRSVSEACRTLLYLLNCVVVALFERRSSSFAWPFR